MNNIEFNAIINLETIASNLEAQAKQIMDEVTIIRMSIHELKRIDSEKEVSTPTEKTEVVNTSHNDSIIIPTEDYVKMLLDNLCDIKDCLGILEFDYCRKALTSILKDGDFDDVEEIMTDIHEVLDKFIYGSYTKVSVSEWEKLKLVNFLYLAGYSDITTFGSNFTRPILAKGGIPITLKQIQQKPMTLIDCGEKNSFETL